MLITLPPPPPPPPPPKCAMMFITLTVGAEMMHLLLFQLNLQSYHLLPRKSTFQQRSYSNDQPTSLHVTNLDLRAALQPIQKVFFTSVNVSHLYEERKKKKWRSFKWSSLFFVRAMKWSLAEHREREKKVPLWSNLLLVLLF